MYYMSTRDNSVKVTSAEAIAKGISPDGGLYVPSEIPSLNKVDFENLCKTDYKGRAKYVLKYFLTDFTDEEIDYCVNGAYSGTFDNDEPAPLYKLSDGKYILELWHGPTCAFKDLALQLLPFLLTTSSKKVGKDEIVILVATSGDTGKAALEGFKDVKGTKIMVFYPNNGVSAMQKLQMDTQAGDNVFVCSINGNFDDAQSGVKKIFTDKKIEKKLADKGLNFSSANSINWGRLVPQIVYYISAYCDLLNKGEDLSKGFDVVVPTGNFGNILAAYYAMQMGAQINKLVCASNKNNVLTDFINTGKYDRNRKFFTTISPSMDILISSNLERMLFELNGRDSSKVKDLMNKLSENGEYEIDKTTFDKLKNIFDCGCTDDEKTVSKINEIFKSYHYLCDTHTSVAMAVCDEYLQKNGTKRPVVVASTASPYKFAPAVLRAVAEDKAKGTDFEMVDALSEITGTSIPKPLIMLRDAKLRFNEVCEKEDMPEIVLNQLI